MSKAVRVERDGPLAIMVIDNPPVNLWDEKLGTDLADAIAEVEADLPRALLIRADGRVVSGGVDVALFDNAASSGRYMELLDGLLDYTHRLEAFEFPVVFCAHALTLTWALELALACDLIIAADDCAFGLVEARIGLTPSMGGTQRLAARAGDGRAREFVMTGEPYPAKTMHEWGVVNRLAPADEVDAVARELAMRLANGPTLAHAATKKILRERRENGVDAADAMTIATAGALFETEDLIGGVKSFLTEGFGKATFNGR